MVLEVFILVVTCFAADAVAYVILGDEVQLARVLSFRVLADLPLIFSLFVDFYLAVLVTSVALLYIARRYKVSPIFCAIGQILLIQIFVWLFQIYGVLGDGSLDSGGFAHLIFAIGSVPIALLVASYQQIENWPVSKEKSGDAVVIDGTVWSLLLVTMATVKQHKMVLINALLLAFGASFVLEWLSVGGLNVALKITLALLVIAVQTIIATTTHRIIILGPNSVSKWGLTKWTTRESYFALHATVISFSYDFLVYLKAYPKVALLAAFVLLWGTLRLLLVFPGIATDKGVSFRLSWLLTKSYQKLMLMVVIFMPTIAVLFSIMTYKITTAVFLDTLVFDILLVLEIAMLSVAYQYIIQRQYGQPAPA